MKLIDIMRIVSVFFHNGVLAEYYSLCFRGIRLERITGVITVILHGPLAHF